MTSSLDWAGLVPVVAAAVQTAVAVVQVYWDRRDRGAWVTQHPVETSATQGSALVGGILDEPAI
ncbi:hypothetical protein ACFQ7J_07350 [Streptomyces sp. NPDC056501]|uniref:hypothetical protein n=1 Tax=Streptomyces sp. NPDC056501 TaxID=3345841 RepID=UPI0036C57283